MLYLRLTSFSDKDNIKRTNDQANSLIPFYKRFDKMEYLRVHDFTYEEMKMELDNWSNRRSERERGTRHLKGKDISSVLKLLHQTADR